MPIVNIKGKAYETGLVIFDKDGTILDFKATWIDIIDEFIQSLCRRTNLEGSIRSSIENALGISIEKAQIDGYGPLAMGTYEQCNTLVTYCLYREGIRWDKAWQIAREAGTDVFSSDIRRKSVKPSHGALKLLQTLKSRGISIAIATNDKRDDAVMDMRQIGAYDYIDLVIGADSVENPKPAPDMIRVICSHLKKEAKDCVMVGDTTIDAIMGKNSGIMLNIGISGILPAKALEEYMDVVISDLDDIS